VLLVLGTLLLSLGPARLLFPGALDAADRWAVLYGGCLAAANAVAAYALVRWSEHRPMRMFFRAILGGMAARMAVMLLAVAAGVKWLHLPPLPLAVSLLGYFVLFLVMEVVILQRHPRVAAGAAR